jgi:RNA polymerase sigma-70 factor (ECF subfamily)
MAIGTRTAPRGDPRSAAGPGSSLLADARSGSVEALGRLFESIHGHLTLAARRGFPRRFQAIMGVSDVVQDAIVAGHAQFHAFRGGSPAEFLGWMRVILSHTLTDSIRRQSTQRRQGPGRPVNLAQVGSHDAAIADTGSLRPLPLMIRMEEGDLVRAVLDELPADQRRALWLHHWEGKTFAAIGVEMGRSEEAVRKLWVRGFKRIEERLRSRGQGGDSTSDCQ